MTPFRPLAYLLLLATLPACHDGGGGGAPVTPEVALETSRVARIALPVGNATCPFGGVEVNVGFDANRNGTLDASEVLQVERVCNGNDGYSMLADASSEPAGIHCPVGGQHVSVGMDTDRDGILDTSEIIQHAYVCDGQGGMTGAQALTDMVAEPAGANCPAGGQRISFGTDNNRNNLLDAAEASTFRYVCNGVTGGSGDSGVNSLVGINNEGPGANCSAGGKRIDTGLDDDRSGVLDPVEIDSTSYVCNGAGGATGASGFNSLIALSDEPPGAHCSSGGKRVDSGLDTSRNNILEAGEITSTEYVCSIAGTAYTTLLASEARADLCLHGATLFKSGPDIDGDNVLDAAEVVSTTTICQNNSAPYLRSAFAPYTYSAATRTFDVYLVTGDWLQGPVQLLAYDDATGDDVFVTPGALPPGVSVSQQALLPGGALVFSGLDTLAVGDYPVTVALSDGEAGAQYTVNLHVRDNPVTASIVVAPAYEGLDNELLTHVTFSEPLPSSVALDIGVTPIDNATMPGFAGNRFSVCIDGDNARCTPYNRGTTLAAFSVAIPAGAQSVLIRSPLVNDTAFAPLRGQLVFSSPLLSRFPAAPEIPVAFRKGSAVCAPAISFGSGHDCGVMLSANDDDGSASVAFANSHYTGLTTDLLSVALASSGDPLANLALVEVLINISGSSSVSGATLANSYSLFLGTSGASVDFLLSDYVTDPALLLEGWLVDIQLIPQSVTTGTPATTQLALNLFIPGTHPRFDPTIVDLPTNLDLFFLGTNDGSAFNPGSGTALDAFNDLDGWSTNASFDIAFAGGQIDPATVNTSRVLLLPLETVGDALPLSAINAATPFEPSTIAATAYSVSVVSVDGGNNNALRIKPLQPLLAKKKYLVVITNGIRNTNGDPLTRSAWYDLLASSAPIGNPAFLPLRDAIDSWLALAAGYLNATTGTPLATANASVVLTYSFTTTDPVAPLVAMGAPRAALYPQVAALGDTTSAVSALNAADAGGVLPSPKPRSVAFPLPTATNSFDVGTLSGGALAANRATLYTGSITLPYYLTAGDGSLLVSPGSAASVPALNNFWRGDDGLASALGLSLQADGDGTYNTTYRFPFAKPTGNVNVPLQVTLPNPAFQPAGFATTCGALAAGAGGYPVVIFVHGVGADRSSVIALAHALASGACVATVAIDLPMHGLAPGNALWHVLNVDRADQSTVASDNAGASERHFDIARNAQGQALAMNFAAGSDTSGAWFFNLASIGNTRDNLRQAVQDLLNLNASLAAIDANQDGTPDLDTSKVSVIGVSFGGMVATTFAAVNEAARKKEADTNAAISLATGGAVPQAFTTRLNKINALVASAVGGQISRTLEHSNAFAPALLAGLHEAGAAPGSSAYETYLYVMQSALDSADPLNFAATLRALDVPVLVQEIVGGGNLGDGVYGADKVMPNSGGAVTHNYVVTAGPQSWTTDAAPLAGTDPLIALLGIGSVASTPVMLDMTVVRGAATHMAVGHHTSLLTTNAGASPAAGNVLATSELQTQAVSFIAAPSQTAFGSGGGGAAATFTGLLTR